MTNIKHTKRSLRHQRVRAKVSGTSERPRAAVHRSLQHVYVQLIDDTSHTTLLAFDDSKLSDTERSEKTKSEQAHLVGKKIGELAKKQGIEAVVFDRGGYKYHGRVKAVAEGIRESGVNV